MSGLSEKFATTRRRFFGVAGSAVLAAKTAAEAQARNLGAISHGSAFPMSDLRNTMIQEAGHGVLGGPTPVSVDGWQIARDLRNDIIRKALNTPRQRAELESILYQMHRNVHSLDHDLAANRCYSLAAKITYQRQRQVASAIDETVLEQSNYQRMTAWRDRILSFAGIKL